MQLIDLATPYARLRPRMASAGPSPALEAARLEAVRQLAQAFEKRCAATIGGRKWFSHFESWLWASRASTMLDAGPVPVVHGVADDDELLRKLVAAGVEEPEAISICKGLAEEARALTAKLQTASVALCKPGHAVRISCSPTAPLVTLTCGGVVVQCTAQHLEKLRLLFETTCARARSQAPTAARRLPRGKRRRRGVPSPSEPAAVGGLDFFAAPRDNGSAEPQRAAKRSRPASSAARSARDAVADQSTSASAAEPIGTDEAAFAASAFSCLARVLALQGGHEKAGGMQAACPATFFDCLRRHFGVASELFASPLNARFPTFCSAAADVDGAFGSVGSFFGAKPRRGAYLANPPFSPLVVEAMAHRMARLLAVACRAAEPLTFVVVLPHWPDKRCWQALATQRCMRANLLLPQQEHGYVEGGQWYQADQRWRPSNHDSSVILLQSDEAAATLPLTPTVERALRAAFQSICGQSKRYMRRQDII